MTDRIPSMPPKRSPSLFFLAASGGSTRTDFRGYGKQAQASGRVGHHYYQGQPALSPSLIGVHAAVSHIAHHLPSFQNWLLRSDFGSREESASVALASLIAAPASAFVVQSSLLRAPVEVLDGIFSSGLVLAGMRAPHGSPALLSGLSHLATVDSGAEVHLLTLQAAQDLFRNIHASQFRVVGITNVATTAEIQGRLLVDVQHPTSGVIYRIDFGTGHGMKDCPLNLLSVSLMIDIGAVLHFERGNTYIQPPNSSERIPLTRSGGLFQFPLHRVSEGMSASAQVVDYENSFAVNGFSLLAGDLKLWHRRNRHIPLEVLRRIHVENLVDGFKLVGSHNTDCACDTCHQTRIRRRGVPRTMPYGDPASFIGHTISTDLKDVPYLSIHGFRYVVNFIDHHSRFSLCYFYVPRQRSLRSSSCFVLNLLVTVSLFAIFSPTVVLNIMLKKGRPWLIGIELFPNLTSTARLSIFVTLSHRLK